MLKTTIKKEVFLLEGIYKNKKILNSLKKTVLEKTKGIEVSKTNVIAQTTGFNFLRSNFDFVEFIKGIKKEIDKIYPYDFIIIDAWGNSYSKGQYAKEHAHHDTSAFCGILYLTNNGPGTYFSELNLTIKEEVGKFVLFSPLLKHSVDKHVGNGVRVTVAFNMHECKSWLDYNNGEYTRV
jgi:hypothetical protein